MIGLSIIPLFEENLEYILKYVLNSIQFSNNFMCLMPSIFGLSD